MESKRNYGVWVDMPSIVLRTANTGVNELVADLMFTDMNDQA